MRRPATAGRILTSVGLAISVAAAAGPPAPNTVVWADQSPQEQQVFRSGANAVSVDVTVRDRNRRAVTGLTAADFTITDNGVPQEIANISFGQLPIDVTVALDVSYSVTGLMLDRLRTSVVQLMGDLTPKDRLKLMLFNSRVARTVDFTSDTGAVEAAMRAAVAGGGTSLLDTISVSLLTPAPTDRRQLLVVFCDGSDSTSTTTPEMLANIALRSHATIAMVLPGARQASTVPPTTRANIAAPVTTLNPLITLPAVTMTGTRRVLDPLFETLAAATGGAIVPAPASADLSAVFRWILRDFRSAYVLHYNVQGVDRAGYHTLDVKVKRPNVEVIARRGYWY